MTATDLLVTLSFHAIRKRLLMPTRTWKISAGTEIQRGAIVNIFSKKDVIISGGVIRAGAIVNINATNVDIQNEFDIEPGGQLNINTK